MVAGAVAIHLAYSTAARLAIRYIRLKKLRCKAGEKLSDGTEIVCFAHVRVGHVDEVMGVRGPRNLVRTGYEKAFGLEKRVFVALLLTSGETLLLLLKTKALVDDTASVEEVMDTKHVDTTFSGGAGWTTPLLEDTAFRQIRDSTYALSPRKALTVQRLVVYQLTLYDDQPEALAWFEAQAEREPLPQKTTVARLKGHTYPASAPAPPMDVHAPHDGHPAAATMPGLVDHGCERSVAVA